MRKIFLDLVSFAPVIDNLSDVDTGFERIKEKVKTVKKLSKTILEKVKSLASKKEN